jgi:hypothetical protein
MSESRSKTAEEKRLLLELARIWAQAAASDSTTVVVNYTQASTGRPCKPPNDVPTPRLS